MSNLSSYLLKLSKLKVDRSKGAPAPHKAILLISVIQLIDNGFIIDNNIGITPELVARFKDNWRLLVIDDRFNSNFSLPFYHLKSDKFWKLKTILGKEILLTSSFSIRSFTTLKDAVDFAYFEVSSSSHLSLSLFLSPTHSNINFFVDYRERHSSTIQCITIFSRCNEESNREQANPILWT
jgi:putative restriction endonuclease